MAIIKRFNPAVWRQEFNDLVRGVSGGFLFGIPLLYTMEVWWIGSSVAPLRLLIAIALTSATIFLLNQTSGFRGTANVRFHEAAMDSIEALALGLFCTTCVLVLLQEITLNTPLGEALGKLIYESVPFALGVSLANQLLNDSPDEETSDQESDKSQKQNKPNQSKEERKLNGTFADIGATLVGGAIIGFNIAPTDEVKMLSAATSGPWLIGLVVASLLISYAIVFAANFSNQKKRRQQEGIFQDPFSETAVSYLASLIAAVLMLWFFNKLTIEDPWSTWVSYTIILGLPTTVGGAAGRLAI
jgi:putative integral membrane protein (TIGR02587 family)